MVVLFTLLKYCILLPKWRFVGGQRRHEVHHIQ